MNRESEQAARDGGWSPAEDAQIRRLYPRGGAAAVAAVVPTHSLQAIRKRAERLQVTRTTAEARELSRRTVRAALIRHDGQIARAAKALGVPPTSLQRHAQALGLVHPRATPRWTPEEQHLLRTLLEHTPPGAALDVSRFPGRTPAAVMGQATRLRRAMAGATRAEAEKKP